MITAKVTIPMTTSLSNIVFYLFILLLLCFQLRLHVSSFTTCQTLRGCIVFPDLIWHQVWTPSKTPQLENPYFSHLSFPPLLFCGILWPWSSWAEDVSSPLCTWALVRDWLGTERLNPINLSICSGLFAWNWPSCTSSARGESFSSLPSSLSSSLGVLSAPVVRLPWRSLVPIPLSKWYFQSHSSLHLFYSPFLTIYMYAYIYVCVCVYVCAHTHKRLISEDLETCSEHCSHTCRVCAFVCACVCQFKSIPDFVGAVPPPR